MRYYITVLSILFFTFCFLVSNAEARRFGGGRSFGVQRSVSNFSRPQSTQSINKPATATANKWFAPLAGLAAGGLLAYLLMGHGIGSGILAWLAIGTVILLLINFFRNRAQPIYARTQNNFATNQTYEASPSFTSNPFHSTNTPVSDSFDTDTFIRDAKTKFLRMQNAFDNKNLTDLREFTTPEVFAEIQLQLQERGDANNQTDVVSLDAELLNIENEFGVTFASVRFSGQIKEEAQAANPFNEIWHFRKNSNDNVWFIAGVQQH